MSDKVRPSWRGDLPRTRVNARRMPSTLPNPTAVETVLFYRIRRVISEPRQVIWVYDQDAWAKGLDYGRLPLDISKRVYEPTRAAIIHYVGLHYERNGTLEFVHSVTGLHTLRDLLEWVASHNEHHLGQIRIALRGASEARGH
jgi:hypothetical protein